MKVAPTCWYIKHNAGTRSVVDDVGAVVDEVQVAATVEAAETKHHLQFQFLKDQIT